MRLAKRRGYAAFVCLCALGVVWRAEAVDGAASEPAAAARQVLEAAGVRGGLVVHLGCGDGQLTAELRASESFLVQGLDTSAEKVAAARQHVAERGLYGEVTARQFDGKRLPFADGAFRTVVSNSIVHHIPDPRTVLAEAWRVAAPGGLLFFRDLFRPGDETTLRRLVDAYAVGATEHQRQMLADSLHAALTVEEVQGLVAELGAPRNGVRATSDRHWTWEARK